MGLNAFEAFAQAVFNDATGGLEVEFPWWATLGGDTFISSLIVDLTDAVVQGKPINRETVSEALGKATSLTFNVALPMLAQSMNLDPVATAILPGVLLAGGEQFLRFLIDFQQFKPHR